MSDQRRKLWLIFECYSFRQTGRRHRDYLLVPTGLARYRICAEFVLVWHLMTSYNKSWLRVDQVPGFRSPADALVWVSRMYLASVRVGKEPPPLVDQMLVSVFSDEIRDAFRRTMHHTVTTWTGHLELKSPTDYTLARHERRLLDSIERADIRSGDWDAPATPNAWLDSQVESALLTLRMAFDVFDDTDRTHDDYWPPGRSLAGSHARDGRASIDRRPFH
ncbi:MAG: hypothetical protein AAGL69_05850 [Pseudomonadota bacterium]